MKGKKGTSQAENILMIGGALVTLFGAFIFITGVSQNNTNSVGTGAVTMLVGIAILSIARKFF